MEKNLSIFIPILLREYIGKQENVRREIENKQRYLADFQQTQIEENKQLIQRFEQIQQHFQMLSAKYQQVNKSLLSFLSFNNSSSLFFKN